MRRIGHGVLLFLFVVSSVFLVNCGSSGGGSGSGTGTLSMSITDAKPTLPVNDVVQVVITIDEIQVHKSGGGWTRLELANGASEYELDIMQYYDGDTTALVLPVTLSSGRYTQIRLGVKEAYMVSTSLGAIPLEIPSEYLKTDKNFEFDLPTGGTSAVTIDFDLSQSIVATGSGTYQLKPVLHVVKEQTVIEGNIAQASFGSADSATVTLYWDYDGSGTINAGDVIYTSLVVEKGADPTAFRIYWVTPNLNYVVRIEADGNTYTETVAAAQVPEGAEYMLNEGDPISF